MSTKTPTPMQQALDEIEKLGAEDQQAVIEIVRQRLIERRRQEIARNRVRCWKMRLTSSWRPSKIFGLDK